MLTSDFKEFVALFNSNRVDYLVVGGYALAAYGHPRYTGDLDFWIGTDPANAEKVVFSLAQFDFSSQGIQVEDLTRPNQVLQLGYAPARIDLLTSIDGVAFAECHTRKIVVQIDGLDICFISQDDFKRNKRATGHLKDLADLEALERPK